jgi:cold shock protein
MEQGTVKFFNTSKGFGFIKSATDQDVFFHISQRNSRESSLPKIGDAIYFEYKLGVKGPTATTWQMTVATTAPEMSSEINPEQDRRDGYRPGVMVLFRLKGSNEVLLGTRRSVWTWMRSVMHGTPHDAPEWMFSWGVPQGGIEEGETFEAAIRREINEELGDYGKRGWCRNMGTPRFLFKERSSFRVEKDGKVWKGKAIYAFLVEANIPDEVFDWMYGRHQDEFWTLPTPEFEGGVQFYEGSKAIDMVRQTQKGQKGKQLERLLEFA